MLRSSGNVGKYIGGYHITLELASSASSRVFLGESVSPDRHNVAIKRFYAIHISSRQEQESFLQEANLLKQFDHPYILHLLSADVIKGTPYIVSEYSPNGSLHDHLQRIAPEPMAQNEALMLLSQIGQALHYVHQKNRVHGNLKPQNILFNGKGDALLADFKFASLSSSAGNFVATSPAALSYMSPEQIEGVTSKENDQYSLGCIAYEMFTGRKPFTTPSLNQPGTYYKTRALIAPRKLNPVLPQRIEQAILKAMSREPSQRYGSVLEFIKALGTPGILVVPDTSPFLAGTAGNASAPAPRHSLWGKPLLSGLKLANPGAMTLAQFTNKATLFRNTFSSLTNFSSLPLPNWKPVYPPLSRGKRNTRRSLLVIASLLLITAIAAGMVFVFSPFHLNNTSTGPGTTSKGTTSGITKTMVPQPQTTPPSVAGRPTTKKTGAITVPAQPTQQPPIRPRPTQAPTPKPLSPTSVPTLPSTTAFSVAPASLNSTNCTSGNGSATCRVTLSLGAGAGSGQRWYTYSIGVGANFNPSNGSIAPGQTINIKIIVSDTCTKAGTFVFVGSKTNVVVAWNC